MIEQTVGQLGLFVAAGVVGGAVNSAAGGAKLFVFPMLLAAGLPPVVANVTSTISLWPAQLPALLIYRRDFAGDARALLMQMAPALVGALLGALALIWSSEAAFMAAIPALLTISVVAIVLGKHLATLMQRVFPGDWLRSATGALLFGTGFYGGYFGAGLGFMLIAVLSVAGGIGLHKANASKNLFAFCMNTTAVIPLALSGLVEWTAAAGVLLGGMLGGYLGARLIRKIPEHLLRGAVAVLGVGLTASFLLR
ncbi:MAG: putative membrane protein YfcA [Paracoccaceae bacterium]|jgi:uncharacterized membrane protein YfcA